jgi:hypothetical protein
LLASPSDARPKIKQVEEAILAWNAMNADAWSIVFRPVRWERDIIPAWGAEAQDCINRELVDNADGMVALFWHRLGAPTSTHVSGTVEEIERFAATGKRPAVYVCKEPLPAEVDATQLGALRDYEVQMRTRGLVFPFAKPDELQKLCFHYLTALAPNVMQQHQRSPQADALHGAWNDVGHFHTLDAALRQMVYLRRQIEVLYDRISRLSEAELEAAPTLGGTDWERAMMLFEEVVMRLPERTHLLCRSMAVEISELRAALLRPLLQGGPNLRAAQEFLVPAMVDLMLGIEDIVRETLADLQAERASA